MTTVCRVLIALIAFEAVAIAGTVVLDEHTGERRLGAHMDLLEDAGGRLTIADMPGAAFMPSPDEVPNLGLTASAYWIRIRLQDRSAVAQEWRLEFAWPVVDEVTLHLPDAAGGAAVQRAGDRLPFAQWELPYRNPTFRVPLAAGEARTVYLRVAGEDTMLLPLTLWSTAAFDANQRREAFLFGFYYGVLAILVTYNLVLLYTLWDRSYLFYVLLIAAWGLYHASLNGLAAQYLWPNSPLLARWSIHLAAILAFTFAGLFARSFLLTRIYAPLLDRYLLVTSVIGAGFLAWPLFGSVHSFIVLGGTVGLSSAALMVVAGVRCWRAGYRPARYYVATWTVGITALFIWALRGYGLVPSNLITDRAFEMVVLSTAITLSLGLADRVNVLRDDLEVSVREKERLLDEVRQLNRDLESRIDERTATLARRSQELAEKSRRLEVAGRHKSAFLAAMSHELRTPLNAIIGFSQLLLARMYGPLNDKQEGYVDDIHDSGRHLLSLINDILDLSKIEAGRVELDLSRVDLPSAIGDAAMLVRERAHLGGVALSCHVGDDLGEVMADERRLKQVLVNLLSNAVRFTPAGGAVEVTAARHDGAIEVAVRDTGIGIAPVDQEVIFEEFRQVGADAGQRTDGTGLGLSLARRLVELHGGRIWVTSAPGKGSTFTFRIPMR